MSDTPGKFLFELPSSKRKLLASILALLFVFIAGTLGYHIFFNRTLLEAFYFMLITMTTIGYREMDGMSDHETLFTIFVIVTGYSIFAFSVALSIKILVEGEILGVMEKRKMKRRISQLKDHTIICGFGRMGKVVAEELHHADAPFCIVEDTPEMIVEIESRGYLVVQGNAKDHGVLEEAGIEHARCIICATGSDPDNLYIVITARQINPGVNIISRALNEDGARNMYHVGADKVIQPYTIGGRRLSLAALKPHVDHFLDRLQSQEQLGLAVEEIKVAERSPIIGKPLAELALAKEYGVIILGYFHAGEKKMLFNPAADVAFAKDDVIIIMGSRFNLHRLKQSVQQAV